MVLEIEIRFFFSYLFKPMGSLFVAGIAAVVAWVGPGKRRVTVVRKQVGLA